MRELTKGELEQILDKHAKWLNNEEDGERADLSNANLRDANLRCADLSDADLIDADLRGANLSGANLSNANLIDADLRGADLRGANLIDADLSRANLRCADLSDADLRGADLRGADLSDANLSDADLIDADLRGANLKFNINVSQLRGKPIYQATCQIGNDNRAMTLLAEGKREEWRFFVGCWAGTEDELRAKAVGKFGEEGGNCFEAIEFLKAMATKNADRFNQ